LDYNSTGGVYLCTRLVVSGEPVAARALHGAASWLRVFSLLGSRSEQQSRQHRVRQPHAAVQTATFAVSRERVGLSLADVLQVGDRLQNRTEHPLRNRHRQVRRVLLLFDHEDPLPRAEHDCVPLVQHGLQVRAESLENMGLHHIHAPDPLHLRFN